VVHARSCRLHGIDIAGTHIQFKDTVKLLGVTLDSTLCFEKHVADIARQCHYQIRALKHIRPLLRLQASKTFASSVVGSVVTGYCTTFFRLIWTNSSECRTFGHESLRSQSLPPNSDEMHTGWLPNRQRVIYKLFTLTCTPYSSAVLFSRSNTCTGQLYVCDLLKIIAFFLFLLVLNLLLPLEFFTARCYAECGISTASYPSVYLSVTLSK